MAYAQLYYHLILSNKLSNCIEVYNLMRFSSENTKVFSEVDDGIYDAMNNGFYKSTGDVVGNLNSDDYYSNICTIHTS